MSRAESKHMCSWWWASHISPKNSKWLQENLTDMDTKVKLMIKLIEVDEDSFATRAEMYYKKRPELMKLVEEFYRAYRALAERYDHATGVIKHAHKTMAQAFPNQVSFLESEDGSFSSADDLVELQKGVIALTRSDLHSAERNRPFRPREAPLAKLAEGVRIALSIYDTNKGAESQKNELFPEMIEGLSQSERLDRSEAEIKALNEALAKLEAEKEAGLLQYKKSVQRLSNLESEVIRAQEDSKGFHERASKGEVEVQSLKESLVKLEEEREATLSQYQQCLDRISSLETDVSRAQCEAKNEVQVLKEELVQLKTEKEDYLAKYVEALENIANLESKLLLAEYKASLTSERADNAEKEVATLKEALSRITEEKEADALRYQQCLDKIASLENKIALSREAVDRIKAEMDRGVEKLKGAEEQCLVLERSNTCMQNELDSALFKVGVQNEEISGQQKEMGRLWTCIQEERVRCVEAETAFRTLKSLHSQTQEELRSVGVELEKRIQLLKDMEVHNQNLQGEVQKIRDENKILNDINVNSSVSLERMQDEILNLKEEKVKLNEELELRLDQRNTLQLEICCLKEELNSLDKKHQAMLEQVESVDLQPDCFVLSIKDLQVENSKLKKACQNNEAEMSFLLEKLGVMEKLVEKNAILEHSLSELMNTLFDVNAELEALRNNSRSLEDSCRLLNDEKSVLVNEREALELKLETAHQRLEELRRKHADLEKSYHGLEGERVTILRLVEDRENSLAAKSQEHDLSQMQITETGSEICLLQELVEQTRDQLEEELDKAVSAQFEIFILRNILQDLQGTNSSLLKNGRILEENKSLRKAMLDLNEEKHKIELLEAVTLDTLSSVLKNIILEGSDVIKQMTDDVYSCVLEDNVRILDGMLGEYQMENLCLRASLEKYDGELKEMKTTHNQLECEFSNEKEKLLLKEVELLLAEALSEEQGKQIYELSERYNRQLTKSECLEESMQNLEAEICIMQEEQKEANIKVEMLRSDLKKGKTEAEQWESVAGTFFVEMQTSSVCETLYREKLFEIIKEHQCLDNKNDSDGLEVMQLKETVGSLEKKDSQVEGRRTGYLSTMTTLRNAVASLERHVFITEVDNDEDAFGCYSLSKGKEVTDSTSDGLSDLQDIAVRIKAVDNKVKQAKRLAKEKSLVSLKSQNPSDDHHYCTKQLNQSSDNELSTKDIMLVQVSETSSRRKNTIDWYSNTESDDQIFDLWNTIHKPDNSHKEQYSSDIPVEKELRVDSLELSKRYLELNELESNNKIIDRLSSDVQSLNNLQITIQDLKQKVVTKPKDTEYTVVKEKLEEAEKETAKLLNVNHKLVNHAEKCSAEFPLLSTSLSFDDPSEIEGGERRRKVCEQALRCSEKIERLQVEVQKIQFLVMKIDDSNKVVEPDRKVLLRDYLYGKAHIPRRRKNSRFCGCIQSPTTGD